MRHLFCALTIAIFVGKSHGSQPSVAEIAGGQIAASVQKSITEASRKLDTMTAETQTQSTNLTINKKAVRVSKIKPFKMTKVHIAGSTIYEVSKIESIFSPYYGKVIDEQALSILMGRIVALYESDGYMATSINLPIQDFRDGQLKIQIYEARISQLRVKGTDELPETIKALGENLKALRPIEKKALERYVLQLSQIPGVIANANLRLLPGGKGRYCLDVEIKQKKFEPFLIVDNNTPSYLGRYQIYAGGSVYNTLTEGDSTDVLLGGNQHNIRYGKIGHSMRITDTGMRSGISYGDLSSKSTAYLTSFNLKTYSSTLDAFVSYPFILQLDERLVSSLTFRGNNNSTTSFGTYTNYENIRSLRLNTYYQFSDSYYGNNTFSGDLVQGFQGLGAKKYVLGGEARGQLSFTKFVGYAAREQALFKSFSILLSAEGQLSNRDLLSEERYAIGGARFGRAYDPGEILGDSGLASLVELRYDTFPGTVSIDKMQFYTSYDLGKVWRRDNLLLKRSESASSLGIGVRTFFNAKGFLELELDKPLTRPAYDEIAEGHNGKAFRFFFRFSYRV